MVPKSVALICSSTLHATGNYKGEKVSLELTIVEVPVHDRVDPLTWGFQSWCWWPWRGLHGGTQLFTYGWRAEKGREEAGVWLVSLNKILGPHSSRERCHEGRSNGHPALLSRRGTGECSMVSQFGSHLDNTQSLWNTQESSSCPVFLDTCCDKVDTELKDRERGWRRALHQWCSVTGCSLAEAEACPGKMGLVLWGRGLGLCVWLKSVMKVQFVTFPFQFLSRNCN